MSGGVVSGREALAEALAEGVSGDWDVRTSAEIGAELADALLASGAVREEAAVRAEALREAAEGWSPTSRVSGGYVASLLRHLADEIDPALAPQDPA